MLYQRELDFLISIFKKCNMPIKTIFPGDLMSGIEDIFTQDFFSAVGEIKDRNFELEDGSVERRKSVDIGLTIDERIADGYYYSGTVRLFKHLVENPELLERPLCEEVQF